MIKQPKLFPLNPRHTHTFTTVYGFNQVRPPRPPSGVDASPCGNHSCGVEGVQHRWGQRLTTGRLALPSHCRAALHPKCP